MKTPRTSSANAAPALTSDVPDPARSPDVVKAQSRLDAITAELATLRRARAATEAELGAGPDTEDFEVEGRLIAEGSPTEPVGQLREYRRREKALTHALGLVRADVQTATEQAVRELTAETRAAVFLPAARVAIAAWLTAGQAIEKFRDLVNRIQAAGVGAGTFSPFNARVPVGLGDREGFAAFARELISDGLADRGQIEAAFPGIV
ncbi:MAG TPA: hypothetical protein VH092_19825 [Urbifossiella sp.]|jgi:hypothetical protein|nr:hypothetical protein [Urbifossiella sp.]